VKRNKVLTVVGTEPITVQNIKDVMKITSAAPDPYMDLLPAAARDAVEQFTGRCIVKKTMSQSLDLCDIANVMEPWWSGVRQGALSFIFNTSAIELEFPPLISVEFVYTYDINNTQTLYASSNYRVDTSDPYQYGRVVLNYNSTWPSSMRRDNSVEVRFTAGYEDGAVPPALTLAILRVAVWAYQNRAACDAAACGCALGDTIDAYKIMAASA